MNYTPFILFFLGLLGILLHNLIKIDSLNRAAKGDLNFKQYIKLEWPTIIISVIVVGIALIAQREINQLAIVGKYLGLAFVAIGYMAQSILVSYMGRAENFLNQNKEKTDL